MGEAPVRYRSADEDSGRWTGFPFRSGDIVISTRSKSGTTWMQMICALMVFQTPDLPDSLGELSPWLDWLGAPRDEVYARLAAQRHRRVIKTHTPLEWIDGADRHELSHYHARAARMAPRDLLRWLHSPDHPRTSSPWRRRAERNSGDHGTNRPALDRG
ncbi:MAG: sulfotransferase domain-containing protein [Micromonosporaceae bacterium]